MKALTHFLGRLLRNIFWFCTTRNRDARKG